MTPQPGTVYFIGPDCGVPFNIRPINFRLISTKTEINGSGAIWLYGYELDHVGQAVEKREIYVIAAGLRPIGPIAPAPRRARNRAPAAARRTTTTAPTRSTTR